MIGAGGVQQFRPMVDRGQQRLEGAWPQELERVRVEGDADRRAGERSRLAGGLDDKGLMSQVDAVEVAKGHDARATRLGRNIAKRQTKG